VRLLADPRGLGLGGRDERARLVRGGLEARRRLERSRRRELLEVEA
jgi:hypothetical protein